MAKKQRKSGRKVGKQGAKSLVELAKAFEALSAEVLSARAELDSKERRLAEIRRALSAATGGFASPERDQVTRGGRRVAGSSVVAKKSPGTASLRDLTTQVLSDGHVRGPAEILAALRKAGYASRAAERTQAVMVAQALGYLTKAGTIKRVDRGRYAKA